MTPDGVRIELVAQTETTDTIRVTQPATATAPVGGTVPATLSLQLGANASFGAFTPGVEHEYTATSTATVTSTAGDAALSVSEPGHLANGAFTLAAAAAGGDRAERLERPGRRTRPRRITFRQRIDATDAAAHRHLQPGADLHLSTTRPVT